MKKTIFLLAALSLVIGANAQTASTKVTKPVTNTTTSSKLELDKASIKQMCGIYKVTFDFVETFATDTAYKYHPRYKEWGIEYVFVAEETPTKIVLQHLLIANDTMIIKHWTQEWTYENTDIYTYYRDYEWVKQPVTAEKAKGTWTQKVFQVDDSPRYESIGTWVHVDGKHYWEGVNDAPLPRREFTKRSDYNVLKRYSRIEIKENGWVLLQDNEKIVRKNGIDKTLCWEKGIERFWTGNYDAMPAIKWWNKQEKYWADVRKAWANVYAKHSTLKLANVVNSKRLFDALFDLGNEKCQNANYQAGSAQTEINQIIESFIVKG